MSASMAEILIVDDDRNLRETLRQLLQDAGYQTRTAANGEEAFALIQTGCLTSPCATGRCLALEASSSSRASMQRNY